MWVETERFEVVDEQGKRFVVVAMGSMTDEHRPVPTGATMYFLLDGTNVTSLADGTFLIERPQRVAKRAHFKD